MKKALKHINNIELYLCYVLLAFMLTLGAVNVFSRYVLNSTIVWAEELCRYALIWISILSACAIVLPKRHLQVDLIDTILVKDNRTLALVLQIIVNIITIAFWCFIFYWGKNFVDRTIMLDPLLKFPMKYVYAILPAGCVILIIRTIQSTVLDIINKGPSAAEEEIVLVSEDTNTAEESERGE